MWAGCTNTRLNWPRPFGPTPFILLMDHLSPETDNALTNITQQVDGKILSLVTAAPFTTVERWKRPKGASTDEQINKSWSVHTLEYYSIMKRKNRSHRLCHYEPQNIMLSERATCYTSPFMRRPEQVSPQRRKADWRLQGLGAGHGGRLLE